MREWEHHVTRTKGNPVKGRAAIAYCGAKLWSYEWAFVDASHARRSVEVGDRLQPAPCCWEVIEKESVAQERCDEDGER